MKQQLIVKETGKPVEFGDIIQYSNKIEKEGVTINSRTTVMITEQTILPLIRQGILIIKTDEKDSEIKVPEDIKYYIEKTIDFIAKGSESKKDSIRGTLAIMVNRCPTQIYQLLLKQIAVELDKQYEGDISQSPEIYAINTFNGKVVQANKDIIKNYRNFAAFRSEKDAKFAKKVLCKFNKLLYGKKQED